MIDEQEAFQDYLELTLPDFRLRYLQKIGSNKKLNHFIRRLRETPPVLDRDVFKETPDEKAKREALGSKKPKHISWVRLIRGKDTEKYISDLVQEMRNKNISEAGITSTISRLRIMTEKGEYGVGHFIYDGKPLTKRRFDILQLDHDKITHSPNVTSQVLTETIDTLETKYPGKPNTNVLRQYVERLDVPEDKEGTPEKGADYFPDLAIGSFDLELTHRRGEIYKYWEGVSAKYKQVINASVAIITEYKTNNKNGRYADLEDDMDNSNKKSFYSAFEELVKSVESPDEWANYIVEFKPQTVIVSDLQEGRIHDIIRLWFDGLEKIELTSEGGADYDKEGQASGWQEDEGATPEDIKRFEHLQDQLNRQTRQDKREGVKLLRTKLTIDPLLYYLVINNKLSMGAFHTEELKDIPVGIKRQIRRLKSFLSEFDDDSVIDELEGYIDKIKDRAGDVPPKGGLYHLPYTNQLEQTFGGMMAVHYISLHKGFLRAVNTLIQPDNIGDRTRDPVRQTDASPARIAGERYKPPKPYPEPLGYTSGNRGKLREYSDKKMKGLISKLIKAIDAYYIDPSNSQYYPFYRDERGGLFDDEETLQLQRTLEVHWDKPKKGNWKAMSIMANKWNLHKEEFVTTNQMKDIVVWLTKLKGFDGRNLDVQIINPAQNAFDSLEEITGGLLTQNNKIYFAKYIDLMARKNGIDIAEQKFPRFGGEFISELAPQFDDKNEDYPIKGLEKQLARKKDIMLRPDAGGTILGKAKKDIMDKFFDLTMVTKSNVESNILDAHDTIRKINGKPIYFAFGDTSDFDNVNNTISIIKKAHNVELMPVEIENIVDDFNSHRSLSKKYGLSEEVIYRVKAMYR